MGMCNVKSNKLNRYEWPVLCVSNSLKFCPHRSTNISHENVKSRTLCNMHLYNLLWTILGPTDVKLMLTFQLPSLDLSNCQIAFMCDSLCHCLSLLMSCGCCLRWRNSSFYCVRIQNAAVNARVIFIQTKAANITNVMSYLMLFRKAIDRHLSSH